MNRPDFTFPEHYTADEVEFVHDILTIMAEDLLTQYAGQLSEYYRPPHVDERRNDDFEAHTHTAITDVSNETPNDFDDIPY